MGADHLVDRVFHDRHRYARGNVLDGRALLLRLLHRGIHEHRAARPEVDRIAREQPQLCKLLDVIAHRLGECADKRSAARRTRLVEHDRIDRIVAHLKALDILAADIEDEIDVGVKKARGLKMRHRLDKARVERKRVFHQLLAVAGRRAAADLHAVPAARQQRLKLCAHQLDGIAAVGAVKIVEDASVPGDQHKLCRRAAAVDAEIRRPLVCIEIGAPHGRLCMSV